MMHNTQRNTIVSVAIALGVIGMLATSFLVITTITPSQSVSAGDVVFENQPDDMMEVEATFTHNIHYLVIETSDGDTTRLYEAGDTVTVDSNGDDVKVYRVDYDGSKELVQTLNYYDYWAN